MNARKLDENTTSPASHEGFSVVIDDNFHHMDPEDRYTLATYPTYEEALARCKACLDCDAREYGSPGLTFEEAFEAFASFGETASVVPAHPDNPLLPWPYVRERLRELCAEEDALAEVPRFDKPPPELLNMRDLLGEMVGEKGRWSDDEMGSLLLGFGAVDELPKPSPRTFRISAVRNETDGKTRFPACHEFELGPRHYKFESREEEAASDGDTHSLKEIVNYHIRLFGTGRAGKQEGSPEHTMEGLRRALKEPGWKFHIHAREPMGASEGAPYLLENPLEPSSTKEPWWTREARGHMNAIKSNVDFILEHLGEACSNDEVRKGVEDDVRAYWAILAEPWARMGGHPSRPSAEYGSTEYMADLEEAGAVMGAATLRMHALVERLEKLSKTDDDGYGTLFILVAESAANILNAKAKIADIREGLKSANNFAPPR